MDTTTIFALAALVVALAGLGWAGWLWWRVRAFGLGLGPRAGPLGERLGTIGRRLEALEAGQAGLEQALGRCGLYPTVVHYAPLGLSGARNCFALALLRECLKSHFTLQRTQRTPSVFSA